MQDTNAWALTYTCSYEIAIYNFKVLSWLWTYYCNIFQQIFQSQLIYPVFMKYKKISTTGRVNEVQESDIYMCLNANIQSSIRHVLHAMCIASKQQQYYQKYFGLSCLGQQNAA